MQISKLIYIIWTFFLSAIQVAKFQLDANIKINLYYMDFFLIRNTKPCVYYGRTDDLSYMAETFHSFINKGSDHNKCTR